MKKKMTIKEFEKHAIEFLNAMFDERKQPPCCVIVFGWPDEKLMAMSNCPQNVAAAMLKIGADTDLAGPATLMFSA